MILDPLYLVCAVLAVIFSGLAKGGFAGIGALAMPVMALGVDPVRGAAIMLPILILQDAVSVWAYRRTWDGAILRVMIPGGIVGVGLGWALATQVSETTVLGVLGLISILFGVQRLWVERRGDAVASSSPGWVGFGFGIASGFTSQIAHAGAPPFQMWVLPKRLSRDMLVGTTTMMFAVLNWVKLPAYAALGQFTRANLMATALLAPLAIVSTIAGVFLVRRIDPARFYVLIYTLMILLGIKLVADALLA